MPFPITVAFATEHDRSDFEERILPRIRGHRAEPVLPEEEDGAHRVGITVTSPSAARDLCHQLQAFLAHNKTGQVTVEWNGPDGTLQSGQVSGDSQRDAEVLALRLGAAAKAHLDAEKGRDAEPAPAQ